MKWLQVLLFNINSISTLFIHLHTLKGSKYCYLIQIFEFRHTKSFKYCYLTLIHLYTVKWFQVLLCITNNSIKHQSFVYTQVNDQTVLVQTIQFSIGHLFAHSLNVKQFNLTFQVLSLRVRVDLGEMAMKRYSAFSKAPVLLEPPHQII